MESRMYLALCSFSYFLRRHIAHTKIPPIFAVAKIGGIYIADILTEYAKLLLLLNQELYRFFRFGHDLHNHPLHMHRARALHQYSVSFSQKGAKKFPCANRIREFMNGVGMGDTKRIGIRSSSLAYPLRTFADRKNKVSNDRGLLPDQAMRRLCISSKFFHITKHRDFSLPGKFFKHVQRFFYGNRRRIIGVINNNTSFDAR